MMKINSYTSLLFAFVILLATACKDDDAPANTPPVFSINSPTEAQLAAGFNVGDDVVIAGTIEDNNLVSTITTEIYYNGIDTGRGETLQVNQKTASVNQTINTSGLPRGQYRFVITAADDAGLTSKWDKTITLR